MARVHDDNPDPAGRGDRRGLRPAPASGEVVGRASHPGPYDDDDDDRDGGPSAADLERFGGETKLCPECGKEVYDDTAICYHCGHAFEGEAAGAAPGKPKVWIIATVVVLVALFALAATHQLF